MADWMQKHNMKVEKKAYLGWNVCILTTIDYNVKN